MSNENISEKENNSTKMVLNSEIKDVEKRIGIASGIFVCPESIDDSNEEIASMFQK